MTAKHANIPYRELGTTGETVSAIGTGGWHIGLPTVDEKLGIRIIRTAIDRGINFLDNSWDYNDGMSEVRGPGQVRTLQNFVDLRQHRNQPKMVRRRTQL